MTRPLAEELANDFTVINYDRRGRGDSGDTAPYAVEREIEDIGALIAEAGGTASVYGHSSGAGLALHAAAHGLPIARLVLHEPPYAPDGEEERRTSREYGEKLKAILAEGRRGDAVALFMTTVGMPAGDGRRDARRAVVGGDGGGRAHAPLRLRGHGRHQQGRHDPDRIGRCGDVLPRSSCAAGRARRG